MSTASIGRPSCVWKSAFSVPSLASASVWNVSALNGTACCEPLAQRPPGTLVISSYDRAPFATHSQTWSRRNFGSSASCVRGVAGPRADCRSAVAARTAAVAYGGESGPPRHLRRHGSERAGQTCTTPPTRRRGADPSDSPRTKPAPPRGSGRRGADFRPRSMGDRRALAAGRRGRSRGGSCSTLGHVRSGTIGGWLATGRLHRLYRGVYLVGHPVPPPLALEQGALLACGDDSFLSYRTVGRALRAYSSTTGPSR